MKLATWNVNSLKVRLEQVLSWLSAHDIDILALQETKMVDADFPVEAFTACGYSAIFTGQKTYNGVAIISRSQPQDVMTDIPDADDPQRRFLAATVNGIRCINLYVPNGAAVGTDKYHYKLAWLEKVIRFLQQELQRYSKVAVVGDFNIAPTDKDVHDPAVWEGCVLVSAPEREAFFQMLALGLKDSYREATPEGQAFSWWDYRAAGFRRNLGLRIDHILLSHALYAECRQVGVDSTPRKAERPSDHAPVWVEI